MLRQRVHVALLPQLVDQPSRSLDVGEEESDGASREILTHSEVIMPPTSLSRLLPHSALGDRRYAAQMERVWNAAATNDSDQAPTLRGAWIDEAGQRLATATRRKTDRATVTPQVAGSSPVAPVQESLEAGPFPLGAEFAPRRSLELSSLPVGPSFPPTDRTFSLRDPQLGDRVRLKSDPAAERQRYAQGRAVSPSRVISEVRHPARPADSGRSTAATEETRCADRKTTQARETACRAMCGPPPRALA